MVLPAYGRGSLADLLRAVGVAAGVPPGAEQPAADLGLPAAERWVLLMVDGLGWELLGGVRHEVPYLQRLLQTGRALTAAVPSTTVTSLTTLGTGLAPGRHGMAGYSFRVPETGRILNALQWDGELDARAVQPRSTELERLATELEVSSVSPSRFRDSGLTLAALRGPRFVGVDPGRDEEHRIRLIVAAAGRGERSLVYGYERELDHTGHVHGCGSQDWLRRLIRIDAYCARLREALPDDVRLVITGDHGMVDVAWADQLVVEDEPELLAGVSLLGGEGRLRQLYLDGEPAPAVAARWADRLGDQAWVRTRDEAVAEGWFGPLAERVAGRFGDVCVAMRGPGAVMTRSADRELSLVGMHGSLTAAEMLVPLLVD